MEFRMTKMNVKLFESKDRVYVMFKPGHTIKEHEESEEFKTLLEELVTKYEKKGTVNLVYNGMIKGVATYNGFRQNKKGRQKCLVFEKKINWFVSFRKYLFEKRMKELQAEKSMYDESSDKRDKYTGKRKEV
jgi:hypothetical protein